MYKGSNRWTNNSYWFYTKCNCISKNTCEKKSEEKHLNYNETKLLLEELYKRLKNGTGYYLLYLGVTSGLRFGELVGLTKDDFDFVNNTISVNKTWGYLKSMHEGFGPLKKMNNLTE